MAAADTPGTVAVADDLFREDEAGSALIGSRCTGCGSHYFPQALSCRNPDCDVKVVEQALLGRRGELYSYTVQHYRPPALFRIDDWTPYAIGLVALPEGLKVMARLTAVDLDALEIGTAVELVLAYAPTGRIPR
jgi:uncharacterized OB-fold protein